MKKFVSHKTVRAAVIAAIHLNNGTNGYTALRLEGSDRDSAPVFWELMNTKYFPKVGDYFVEYEDGYKSISPKAAFEAGYTEVQE